MRRIMIPPELDGMIVTCPACRRSLALADRNGRHVASEAHYPHHDASGTMICSPPARGESVPLTGDVEGRSRPRHRAPLKLVTAAGRKVVPN
jgi:hypothetical protein